MHSLYVYLVALWQKERLITALFFSGLFLLGLSVYRDYGVSWDEPNNHLNGLVTIKYVAGLVAPDQVSRQAGQELIPALRQFKDADHGPLFEVPAALLGHVFTDGDSRSFYLLRHLLVFCGFTAGVWALCQLGRLRYHSWRVGLLTGFLLVVSPRLFAEAFYNGKDILYMSLFTVAIYTLVRLLLRPTLSRAILHALVTAATIDIRVQGLLLIVLTLLLLLLTALTTTTTAPTRPHYGRVGGCYVLVALLGILLGWPYLWTMSPMELVSLLPRMGRYPWPHTNLYWGQLLPVTQLPWHYIPVWILLTTPLPYTAAAIGGIVLAIIPLFRRGITRLSTFSGRFDVLFLLWLLGPLVVVGALHTVVYEGWRHLYFVYPALLLFAVGGLRALWQVAKPTKRRWVWVLISAFFLEMSHTALRMVRLHPYEQMYFSFLSAPTAERLFERDYWGLSYRQGLEWLMQHDDAPHLAINVAWHHPLYNNSLILPPADRARIQYVPLDQARYFITNYRWHPQPYADSVGQEIYTIRAENIKILSIFDTNAQ